MDSAVDLGKGFFTFSCQSDYTRPALSGVTASRGACFPPCQTGRALGGAAFFQPCLSLRKFQSKPDASLEKKRNLRCWRFIFFAI